MNRGMSASGGSGLDRLLMAACAAARRWSGDMPAYGDTGPAAAEAEEEEEEAPAAAPAGAVWEPWAPAAWPAAWPGSRRVVGLTVGSPPPGPAETAHGGPGWRG